MKSAAVSLLALAALILHGSAHYVFPHLVVKGVESTEWQYVRDVRNDDIDLGNTQQAGKTAPIYFDNADSTCGRLIENNIKKTETALPHAGEELAFRVQK